MWRGEWRCGDSDTSKQTSMTSGPAAGALLLQGRMRCTAPCWPLGPRRPVRVVWYLVRQRRFFLFFHANQRTVDHQHPSVAASVCCGVGGGSARLQNRVHKRGGLARLRAPRSAHKHPSIVHDTRDTDYSARLMTLSVYRVRRTQSPVADKTGTRQGASSTYTYYRRN